MKPAIEATLDDYAKAYCAKDIRAMMAVFDDSDNISVIGTGAEEFCVGRDEVRALFENNFAEATANRFEWVRVDTRLLTNNAVMSVKLNIHLDYQGEALCVPIRWTIVLMHQSGRWVWVHRNASTAASGQSDNEAYPTDK